MTVDALNEKLARIAEAPSRKPKTLLSSSPPLGAGSAELQAWVTVVLGLGADPVSDVIRFGRHEDARMVITLKSGARIVFDRQAEVFDAPILRRRVIIATGTTIPYYGPADVQTIATALMQMSELAAEDDDRHEARDWADSFLAAASRNVIDVSDFGTPEGRWEALNVLISWKTPPDLQPYAPAAERAVIVKDTTGKRIVRTSDLAAHVRGQTGKPIVWASLHSRVIEIGWEHPGQVQQRQPNGHGKVKARIYAIPPGWEHQ